MGYQQTAQLMSQERLRLTTECRGTPSGSSSYDQYGLMRDEVRPMAKIDVD